GKLLFQRLRDCFETLDLLAAFEDVDQNGPAALNLFGVALTLSSASPPGIEGEEFAQVEDALDLTLATISDDWRIALQLSAGFNAGLILSLLPLATFELQSEAAISGDARLTLLGQSSDPTTPFILLGQTNGSGLRAKNASLAVLASLNFDATTSKATADLGFEAKITDGTLVIDLADADGFLASVLPSGSFKSDFSLAAGWSSLRGLYINGGAELETSLPLHVSLGPIEIDQLYLKLGVAAETLALECSLVASFSLGPISVSVDRLGITSQLAFQRGNLGPLDFALAFKPPNGLGLAIDAGVAAGGGYISFDPDKGQYAGVLDVSILDTVQVKIIAVLDTIMPDGSKGFAFLLVITFDFPPIQLGFGFTLNGVGGLGGVNRTMSIDALHAGFRAHTLDSILFPPDPVANAPQIISNIRAFFPAAEGRYVFGPMFELGWGTPTLITLAIGVILEVPDPIRIALLGLIDAGLPTEDAPLIELHIDVLGTLDFGTKTFELDGSLYNSRVLIYSLAGDLLFRLCWGDNPVFIFSLGGFNPHFNTAGLNLPSMNRLSVSIGDGDNPRISANSYFAITSNTLQFGANVEAYAAAGGFAIHGYLGYDVLIIFSPFSFEFDFSAGFDVSYDGANLLGLNVDGLFSGPRPWHLHGDASIDFLFFSVSASVDLTWGDSTPVTLPSKPVLPDLIAALSAASNWSAALPDGVTQAVSLSTPKPDATTLRVHPLGTLSVKENVVPLDIPITKYGNATPSDGNYFSISAVQVNGQEEARTSIPGYFAAGQFQTLSDADKLSLPSFEDYDAGVSIGVPTIVTGFDSPRTAVYEEIQIDPSSRFSNFKRFYAMSATLHSALVQQGAGYMSAAKNSGLAKYRQAPEPTPITTANPVFVITGVDDMSIRSDIASASGTTYFAARATLATHLELHPEDAGNLQIVPLHEVTA
ncbi:MAG TPA: DUF6603 domain-containing protein, partial [Blastocatellia bacterium]|nr:DUF6603 domain-containing protein [Blastocatellia bacterium]